MKHIVICDDEADVTREWKNKLEAVDHLKDNTTFLPLSLTQLQDTIATLENRRARARGELKKPDSVTEIDGCDALIVDYDLLKAENSGFITGENLAYLARCYASVGVILGLNQFYRGNVFELDLHSRPESFADLNLSDEQLTFESLWGDQYAHGTFRPWHWPIIPDLCDRFTARVASLEGQLDTPITTFFDFPEIAFDFLDRETLAFVSRDNRDIRTMTFRAFVANSGQGVREKDEQTDEAQIARIAASRVSVWLERMILPAQSAIVDLPHLVERIPSVVGGLASVGAINKRSWMTGLETLNLAAIESYVFKRHEWLSRAAWWWPAIEAAERQPELTEPWNFAGLDSVFCEDISGFRERDKAKPFVVGFTSPFARRYIAKLDGVTYRPQVRLAE